MPSNRLIPSVATFCLVCAGLLGCLSTRQGSTDSKSLSQFLNEWKSALLAGDSTRVLAMCSDDFRFEDKGIDAFKMELSEIITGIRQSDGRVNIADATIEIRDGRASVSPISIGLNSGTNSFRMELVKQNGVWKITGLPKH